MMPNMTKAFQCPRGGLDNEKAKENILELLLYVRPKEKLDNTHYILGLPLAISKIPDFTPDSVKRKSKQQASGFPLATH